MSPVGLFGINNDGLNTAVKLLILVLVVVWLALVYCTYADARRRIDDPMLVGCATAASLFPFVGTIVYMIVRPPEYLEDVRERELEMQAAEARLHAARLPAVPALRLRGREGLPALPELPAQAQGPVRELRPAARPGVDDLPVLRGRDPGRRRPRRRAAAGAAADTSEPPRRPSRAERRRRRRRPPRQSSRDPDDRSLADGPDPHPGQARRVRARPDRRDHRPLRAQGPAHRRAEAHDAHRATRPSSTTPSTRAARSSASSSTSSPPARSSRWCSRATRPSWPPARSSARPTRSRPPPARSAATSRSRSARTWSTARTPPSRPRARPAIFFPELGLAAGPALTPRLRARRSGARSWSSLGVAFEVAADRRRGAGRRASRRGRRENALRKARAAGAARASRRARRRHASSRSTAEIYGKPRGRGGGRATLRAPAGRTHAVVSGLACVARRRRRSRRRAHRRSPSATLDEALLDWYVGDRRVARARRRLRDPGRAARRSCERSTATTSTSSDCRSRRCSSCARPADRL